MWIVPALVGFVVLAWLGYAWMNALFAKYEHTLESTVVLAFVLGGSLFSGWTTASSIAPEWSFGPKAAIALGVGFTLFSLFSFLIANLWTAFLTRRFDEAVVALGEEEDTILRRLEAIRWEAHRGLVDARKVVGEEIKTRDPREDLLRTVEVWEQGGGAARIRSLKVLEWREEASGKAVQEIRDDISSFEIEVSMEPDEAKKEQIRARLAVARLALLEKEPPPTEKVTRRAPKPEMKADEVSMRERLQEIQRELQFVKDAKAQYLRTRVKLGWRSGK